MQQRRQISLPADHARIAAEAQSSIELPLGRRDGSLTEPNVCSRFLERTIRSINMDFNKLLFWLRIVTLVVMSAASYEMGQALGEIRQSEDWGNVSLYDK